MKYNIFLSFSLVPRSDIYPIHDFRVSALWNFPCKDCWHNNQVHLNNTRDIFFNSQIFSAKLIENRGLHKGKAAALKTDGQAKPKIFGLTLESIPNIKTQASANWQVKV